MLLRAPCAPLCLPLTSVHGSSGAQDYKEFLEDMVKPEDKNATPFIQDYKEYHTGGWQRRMGTDSWSGDAAAVARLP